MNIRMEFYADCAIMVIVDDGHRTEVRGHRMVGTDYVGDGLDRVLKALPRTVNISELFADNKVGVRSPDAIKVRDALVREEELVDAMFGSVFRSGPIWMEPWYRERAARSATG